MRWFPRGEIHSPTNAFHGLVKDAKRLDRFHSVAAALDVIDDVGMATAGISPAESLTIRSMRIAEVYHERLDDLYSRLVRQDE
jgi:hypothetical protein